ncbi:MAG: hypothetical protein IPI60_19205 [Saprospiraceae bacterium]|nr:hypothetical protein [Saprospiraceae bacterium]
MKSPFVSNSQFRLFLPVIFITFLLFSSCSGTRPIQDDVYSSYNPPQWAPAYGYRADTRYVFFPEIGLYYDLYKNNYIYPYANSWVVVQRLPPAYSSYDLRRLRQQQLTHRDNPQHYSPGNQGSIGNNPPQYTPRRGAVPPAYTPRNNPPPNQDPETVNPRVNTPRRGNQPAVRPPQNTPERNERTNPSRTPVQTSSRKSGDSEVRNQQPVRSNQVPSRVTPPQTKNRGSETQPPRSNSRRGGGAI